MSKKKTHRIYARDGNAILDGIKTSRGKVNFGNKTAVYVDEATAKEVDERYGGKNGDVIVAKDEQYERALNGEGWKIQYDSKRGDWVKTVHNYFFGSMPKTPPWVWAINDDGKPQKTRLDWAIEWGWEIIPEKTVSKKRDNASQSAEVTK